MKEKLEDWEKLDRWDQVQRLDIKISKVPN